MCGSQVSLIDHVVLFIPCKTGTARSSEFGDFELILLIRVDLVVVRADFVIVRDDFVRLILVVLEISKLNYNGVYIFWITMIYNVMVL